MAASSKIMIVEFVVQQSKLGARHIEQSWTRYCVIVKQGKDDVTI